MSESKLQPAILCISTYEKGQAFLREAARLGVSVTLLTVDTLTDADWPREALAEFLTMPQGLTPVQVLNTVCYLARGRRFDRIVALDEFDLETAALLREHMRLPGMGESATRFFRDKLAMRVKAKQAGIAGAGVYGGLQLRCGACLHGECSRAVATEAAHQCIGDRHQADRPSRPASAGARSIGRSAVTLCARALCHRRGVPRRRRDMEWEVFFGAPHKYGHPPMQTMHKGGVFTTRSLHPDLSDARGLAIIHEQVIKALGMVSGVTHTEFIKSAEDGKFYFLETAARVGGAYIAELVEFSKGLNPWVEWARLEVATLLGMEYCLPKLRDEYAGSVICLAKQEEPDLGGYTDLEIVMRLKKHHHAGVIVQSKSVERVEGLLEEYGPRFLEDFCASQPVPDKPTA